MLYWCRSIKTLQWEVIICSLVSKLAFVSKQSRKTFVCHLILQADKIKHSNRGEMTNLHLKSQLLKVSDNDDSCSWDSTKSVCTLNSVNTKVFACFVILQNSNARSEKNSNVEKSPMCRTVIWQYSTTEQLLLHRVVAYSSVYSRAATTLFPWHFAWSD